MKTIVAAISCFLSFMILGALLYSVYLMDMGRIIGFAVMFIFLYTITSQLAKEAKEETVALRNSLRLLLHEFEVVKKGYPSILVKSNSKK